MLVNAILVSILFYYSLLLAGKQVVQFQKLLIYSAYLVIFCVCIMLLATVRILVLECRHASLPISTAK